MFAFIKFIKQSYSEKEDMTESALGENENGNILSLTNDYFHLSNSAKEMSAKSSILRRELEAGAKKLHYHFFIVLS